ncbi:hypothetical protein CURTO8I2_50015 [Curtobacterium sp. 8I-2]|nr:hypothetical protein CURTO8I2_50015 [Curtobacterium sp. 8I-2]
MLAFTHTESTRAEPRSPHASHPVHRPQAGVPAADRAHRRRRPRRSTRRRRPGPRAGRGRHDPAHHAHRPRPDPVCSRGVHREDPRRTRPDELHRHHLRRRRQARHPGHRLLRRTGQAPRPVQQAHRRGHERGRHGQRQRALPLHRGVPRPAARHDDAALARPPRRPGHPVRDRTRQRHPPARLNRVPSHASGARPHPGRRPVRRGRRRHRPRRHRTGLGCHERPGPHRGTDHRRHPGRGPRQHLHGRGGPDRQGLPEPGHRVPAGDQVGRAGEALRAAAGAGAARRRGRRQRGLAVRGLRRRARGHPTPGVHARPGGRRVLRPVRLDVHAASIRSCLHPCRRRPGTCRRHRHRPARRRSLLHQRGGERGALLLDGHTGADSEPRRRAAPRRRTHRCRHGHRAG